MTKTTYIAGIFLSVLFLVAAQSRADMYTFTFQGADSTSANNLVNAPSQMYLTATNNGDGVAFDFFSDWNADRENPMVIKPTDPRFGDTGLLYFYGVNDVFNFDNVGAGDTNMTLFQTYAGQSDVGRIANQAFEKVEGRWAVDTITLKYAEGMGWDDFVASLNNEGDMFAFSVILGEMNPAGWSGRYITTGSDASFVSNAPGYPSPEPATLAVLGLGLAGLGMVSRRRK